jgi:colanic acid/amylovoran biosynthesis glycosyltransferase
MTEVPEIILITDSYPYGDGESSFLKDELAECRRRNIIVNIIPLTETGELHKVLDNCRLVKFSDEQIPRVELLLYLTRRTMALFGDYKNPNLKNPLKYGINFVKGLLRSITHYKKFKQVFETMVGKKNVIIYHYWSHQTLWLSNYIQKKVGLNALRISRAHGYDVFPCRTNMPLRICAWNSMDRIFPVSHAGELVIRNLVNPKVIVEVSRLGVSNQSKNVDVRIEIKALRLVVIAYFNPVKRLHLIVESIKSVDFPCEIYFIGDGPEKNMLQCAASSIPRHHKVAFLGKISNENLIGKLLEITPDLLVSSSSSEGVPVSMMEALSCGIPIASSNVGGVSDIVNSQNGWLLCADAELYKIQLVKVLSNLLVESYESRLSRSMSCIQQYNQKWNSKKNFEEFVDRISNEKK